MTSEEKETKEVEEKEPQEMVDSEGSESDGNVPRKRKNKRKKDDDSDDRIMDDDVPLSFPQRMMEMLSDESHSDSVVWLPHGKGFIILDKKRFAHEVMPKYFNRKAKFTSFTRKLNRWSFTRVTRGPENGAYYHPLFQKNNLRLCLQMSCINSKSTQAIQPMNPVALGMGHVGYPGMMMPGNMAILQEQQLQQQRFMAMMQQQQQQQAGASVDPSSASEPNATSTDVSSSTNGEPNTASMAAFQMQQRQYYAMLMAQQQQMAAMAANPGMVAQFQQPAARAPTGEDEGNAQSPKEAATAEAGAPGEDGPKVNL